MTRNKDERKQQDEEVRRVTLMSGLSKVRRRSWKTSRMEVESTPTRSQRNTSLATILKETGQAKTEQQSRLMGTPSATGKRDPRKDENKHSQQ